MALPYHKNQRTPHKKTVIKDIAYSRYALLGMQLSDPDPVGYQKKIFKPCTVSKIIDLPKRVNEGFKSLEEISSSQIQRGIVIHTDRYSRSCHKEPLRTQNERLAAEEDFVRKAKFLKRLSERRLKSRDQKLILEGENVMPAYLKEAKFDKAQAEERKKQIHSQLDEIMNLKQPHPSMIMTPFLDDHDVEGIEISMPISMEVNHIRLKNRRMNQSEEPPVTNEESRLSQPAQRPHLDSAFFDRLPPLNKPISQQSNEPSYNFEAAFNQSERFGGGQRIRIDRYIMDGVPVKFTERADIQSEIKYLKSLILPKVAKDLYVGRGIQLPKYHATNKMKLSEMNNESRRESTVPGRKSLQLETPNGGSITINSTTPVNDISQINEFVNTESENPGETVDNEDITQSQDNEKLEQPDDESHLTVEESTVENNEVEDFSKGSKDSMNDVV